MYTLPVQNSNQISSRLHSWFQYKTGSQDGFNRLNYFFQPGGHQSATTADTNNNKRISYDPLTDKEEQRWKILERKAKQDNLTGFDAAEHEILLEIKFYHRIKAEAPQLSHLQVLEIIRQSL